jgi:pimeloyl-ACP methyl ester carboxylesterase
MSAGRQAVILPGGNNSTHQPLLFYAAMAAEARGFEIRRVAWPEPVFPTIFDEANRQSFVDPVASAELDAAGDRPLVIGKSLGTHAAAQTARRGLTAIWFTPLLFAPEVVAALEAAAAPFLLIGGTADPHCWDGAVARRLTPHVLEVEGADHGMIVPGPLSASAAVLGRISDVVEQFLDENPG